MGSVACCNKCSSAKEGTVIKTNPSGDAESPDDFVCTEWSHVESLLAHLPPDVHASLEDKLFQDRCHKTFTDIVKDRPPGNGKDPDQLEGDELIDAVHIAVPEKFLQNRLHANDLAKLVLAFDMNADGKISESDFDLFCMWTVAMDVMGFFAGATPFAAIANGGAADNLILISEYLDPEHILGRCVLPNTLFAYYHPDGMTLDEFTAQIHSAAHLRTKQGLYFKSVALANHGPDEEGFWSVCSDHPVCLHSLDEAWPRLMPIFQGLAEMVGDPLRVGNVDLLACNFAANPTGLACLDMIETQVDAKFSASSDATGNAACAGNWEMERGGRNVAPIYFHEDRLGEFTKVMAPGKKRKPNPNDSVVGLSGDQKQERAMEGLVNMSKPKGPEKPAFALKSGPNGSGIHKKAEQVIDQHAINAAAMGDCCPRRGSKPKAKAASGKKAPKRQ